MIETFLATLSPMLVMFACMIIGFVLKKKRITPDNTDIVISKLENYILVPALVISTFMNYCTLESIREQSVIFIYSLIALAVALLISFPLSKLFGKGESYQRNIYKYALTFGNFGFMGNAIVPAILGAMDEEILYKYLLFTIPMQLVVYTWGITILIPKGKGKSNPLKNLLNPGVMSIVIGAFIGILGINEYMPAFLVTTIDYCKACMAPLAMFLTGFVIAGYDMKELVINGKVYIATVLRLFVIPVVILVILKLAGASNLVLSLGLFAYATPLGLNTVVFPAAYGGETRTGAAMAMISHVLCIISIPIMYALFTMIL